MSAVAVCRSSASLGLVEQPRVLDGDRGLVGKTLLKRKLFGGEGREPVAIDDENADRLALAPQRRAGHRAGARGARMGRPGQSAIAGSTLSRSGMWICRFLGDDRARAGCGRRSGAAPPERPAPMRFELSPTRMVWAQPSPSAIWIVTLGAPNRRAVVSAICCNDRSASPGALAMARRISALAFWRSRAARNSACSRAFSCLRSATTSGEARSFTQIHFARVPRGAGPTINTFAGRRSGAGKSNRTISDYPIPGASGPAPSGHFPGRR